MVHFGVRNDSGSARREIARVSLPVPAGLVPGEAPQCVSRDGKRLPAQAHVLTRHPDGSARRVLVSLPVQVAGRAAVAFTYGSGARPQPAGAADAPAEGMPLAQVSGTTATLRTDAYVLRGQGFGLELAGQSGQPLGSLQAFGPAPADAKPAALTVIENGPFFAWLRWRQEGSDYTREVDVQADKIGRLRLTQRILRSLRGNGWTPDFGFELTAPAATPVALPERPVRFLSLPAGNAIGERSELVASLRLADRTELSLANPLALRQRRGTLEATRSGESTTVRFSRIEPVAQEMQNLQIQEGMWRVLELVLQPGPPRELFAALDQPLRSKAEWQAYDAVYHTGPPLQVKSPVLRRMVEKYVTAIQSLSMAGDDWGSLGGLERYNHCQYIWEDYFRTGDPRLRRVALDYSENYNDFSVYWGPEAGFYGGGRYPANAQTQPWPGTFRTRHNNAVTFCTKGYHGFWLAYEETGDPRFRTAAEQQAKWSAANVHATVNYTRCIGQVVDFVKLYEYTGDRFYLENAVRLWTEFQACQNPDLLFNERGVPSTGNDRYVPDDQFGYEHPFVKSYIMQYATNALPLLLAHRPEDKRLRDTVLACNDWMARVQTAGGGWSYPGPTTAGFGWSPEYCHGLLAGHEIEPRPQYLDAVQRDLRALATLFQVYDAIPSSVTPWERLAGMSNVEMGKRYHLGTDRDRGRDFTDGRVEFGFGPDTAVYLQVLLRDYLSHRPEASLFAPDETLEKILRMPASVAGGCPQSGDPSLSIRVGTSATPEGLLVKVRAEGILGLAGKRLSYRWVLPDGQERAGREASWVCAVSGKHAVKLLAREGSREYTRTVTITAPAGPGDIGRKRWPAGIRVQAEALSAQGEGGVKVRSKGEKAGADGGAVSHWESAGSWAEWRFQAPTAGRYFLLFRFASPHAGQRAVAVDGQPAGTFLFAPTGGFGDAATDCWATDLLRDAAGKPLALSLAAGEHLLRLANPDGKGCNLDYVELVPQP